MKSSLLASCLFLAACSGNGDEHGAHIQAATGCIGQFSPDAGYDWRDDLTSPTAPPDGGAPPGGPSSLDQAITDCDAAGAAHCDKSQVMTHDAAICVAQKLGLSDGIASLKAGVGYFAKDHAITWHVQNTTSDDAQGNAGGDWMRLDAITGNLLDQGHWFATP